MPSKSIVLLIVGILAGGSFGYFTAYSTYTPQLFELKSSLSAIDIKFETLTQEHETILQEHETILRNYDVLSNKNNALTEQHKTLLGEYEKIKEEYEALSQENKDILNQYDEIQLNYESLLNKYELLVGSLPLSPEPISTETIDKKYEWYYGGYYWSLSLSVPKSLYEYYKNKERTPTEDYSVYVSHPYDDEYIRTVIQKFNFIVIEKRFTEIDKVNLVIAFVQSLSYTSDIVTTPYDEYPRYPLETLVDDGGDCEDTSILTAALLDELNYDVVLINPPEHFAVGVCIDTYGSYYTYNNINYFYLETTGEGWEIGEIPSDFKGESVYIYPLLPIPIITHDWKGTQTGSKLTLVVDVENVGTAIAKGIKVYAAFDAGEGYVWNTEESEPFDLNFGRKVTIQLILDVPPNKYTRIIVGILDLEDYLIDKSYSDWFNT